MTLGYLKTAKPSVSPGNEAQYTIREAADAISESEVGDVGRIVVCRRRGARGATPPSSSRPVLLQPRTFQRAAPSRCHRKANPLPTRQVDNMADEETQVAGAPVAEQDGQDMAVVTVNNEVAAPTGGKAVKKVIRKKKKRPARVQLDPDLITSEPPPQTGTIFNIWYNKWSGGDYDANAQTKAKSRCNIAQDSGYTKGDGIPGSLFCLFFARGLCPKGADCEYLHRLPGVYDILGPNVDCFGRDKFSDYRDDMGGVGSFMRVNRTIYVGRIHVTDDIEEVVARHFAEWGQVERGEFGDSLSMCLIVRC